MSASPSAPPSPLPARALPRRLATTGQLDRPADRRADQAANQAGARGRGLVLAAFVTGWIGAILVADRFCDIRGQAVLGVATWGVLLAALAGEARRVRVQVGVVVAFASLIEYTFSGLLHVYVYRLGWVPSFVPPGHGLVYLGALAVSRSPWARRHSRALIAATVAAGGAYALWGLTLGPRLDALGAFWFGCLVFFLWRGRIRLVFVGAFVIVTYLELLGTGLGAWTWQPHDFTGIVPIGNPPSGAAGGYGFFDAAALLAAPAIERWLDRAGRVRIGSGSAMS